MLLAFSHFFWADTHWSYLVMHIQCLDLWSERCCWAGGIMSSYVGFSLRLTWACDINLEVYVKEISVRYSFTGEKVNWYFKEFRLCLNVGYGLCSTFIGGHIRSIHFLQLFPIFALQRKRKLASGNSSWSWLWHSSTQVVLMFRMGLDFRFVVAVFLYILCPRPQIHMGNGFVSGFRT